MRFFTLGILGSVWLAWSIAAGAAQPLEPQAEIRGAVQQWAPGARVVKVDGKTYALSSSVQVLNSRAVLQPLGAVRPGMRVQLLMAGEEVSHVVLNPGPGYPMDQPQR